MENMFVNFRDFINPTRKPVPKAQTEDVEEMEDFEPKEVQKSVRPSPQRRVPQKVVERYEEPEEYDEPVDEEYYEEPVMYVPQQRQVQRPVQRVQPRQQVRPQPRPIARPSRPVHNGYAMPDSEFRRPLTVSPKQLKENTIEGTANSLTEAIKRKVDTVFYRFGIQGLEKLDEKILDTIEELQYPEQKSTKRPLREMRRQPVRKSVKKYRPLPLEEVPPVPQEPVYEEPVYQEPISYEDPIVDEPIEETAPEAISEQPVEEIVEEPIKTPPQPKKAVASPKPSFLQPNKVEKPKQIESTGDEDEDLINAAMSMDFNESAEEQKPVVSDEEIWGEVEAILESEPSQKLVHEPQTQSQLMMPPTQVDEQVEKPEEVQEQPTEEPKPKKKRKQKTEETKVEENTINEKE